jgi:dipeptidyl aminopeptidase/acylaminoacyl peptidase
MPPSVELVGAHSKLWRPVEPAFLEVDWSHAPVRHEFPARDGIRLSGWLHGPRGAAGPGPVLLYLHGGPEAEERPGYSYLFPDLVDAGITVFAPNVRGSAGSGRAFGHADEGELRFAGIDDVADCVDYLVAAGIADPARVGCTGRSYGGYLTYASLIHHRDRFAAGMAICGMSDLESFYANTEPWIAEAAHSKYGHPEHDRDLLRELSPIHRIDELEAPLLVVHGAHDSNVPVSESEQLVAAVRARGGVAEFLLLPDEGHEIVTRENHERLAAAMVAWFVDRL